VPLLGAAISARAERGERAPARRRERDGDAWTRIVEGVRNVVGEPLEAIDLAPRRLPAAEIRGELVGGGGERLQQLLGGRLRRDILVRRQARASRLGADAALDVLAPEHGERRGD